MPQFPNTYTNLQDIETYKAAGAISAEILSELAGMTKVGVTPLEVNEKAGKLCKQNKVEPAFLGVEGPQDPFPGNLCISVNDVTLHGIPFSEVPFSSGDIVKLDFGIIYESFYTDHCVTVGVGELTAEDKKLINTARLCVETAIKRAVVGNTTGDIGYALQSVAELEGYNFVTNYVSHGIGKEEHGGLHANPKIPSYGQPGEGYVLEEGLAITIENQVSLGSADLRMDSDGWTLRTKDGSKSAMFEHTLLVGKEKPTILTKV